MKEPLHSNSFFSYKTLLATTAVTIAYLLLSSFLVGFKGDQLALATIFNVGFYTSKGSRKLILGFSIFIVFWIIFDYMKAFPNYRYQQVHIKQLYDAEKYFFGIVQKGQLLTPNEFWLQHKSTFFNIITGFCYLCWVPVPLMFAVYLFYNNRKLFLQFSLTFLWVNCIGFVGYYVYPAAPPWYVQLYGFQLHASVPGNTAGLQYFDDYFGVHVFQSLYAKSSNVFAAMPSLHAAYLAIVLYYGVKNKMKIANAFFAFNMVGIWFAAVYNSHHYVLDVFAGIGCAVLGIASFQQILQKSTYVQRLFNKFLAAIT